MEYLKTDLLGKCIRWKNGGVSIVMKVTDVDAKRVSGESIICERVRCDMFNERVNVCNRDPNFTLYIDGDSIDIAEIISKKCFNRINKEYLKFALQQAEMTGFVKQYNEK